MKSEEVAAMKKEILDTAKLLQRVAKTLQKLAPSQRALFATHILSAVVLQGDRSLTQVLDMVARHVLHHSVCDIDKLVNGDGVAIAKRRIQNGELEEHLQRLGMLASPETPKDDVSDDEIGPN